MTASKNYLSPPTEPINPLNISAFPKSGIVLNPFTGGQKYASSNHQSRSNQGSNEAPSRVQFQRIQELENLIKLMDDTIYLLKKSQTD